MLLQNGYKVPLQLTVLDAAGDSITSLTPPPKWTSSDDSIVKIEETADGFSAVATSGKVGSVTVMAQVSPGVSATLAIDVVPGIPASATITAGTPVPVSGS